MASELDILGLPPVQAPAVEQALGGELHFTVGWKTWIQHLYQLAAHVLVPPGVMLAYGGDKAPRGFLLCDGSAVSRSTYSRLLAIIGTTYGVGDGSTTFNVPNATQRFLLGLASSGTGSTLGGTGGTIDHTHTGPSHTHTTGDHALTVDEMPAHTHTTPEGLVPQAGAVTWAAGGFLQGLNSGSTGGDGAHNHGATGASGTGATGLGNPPFLAVNYIIRY